MSGLTKTQRSPLALWAIAATALIALSCSSPAALPPLGPAKTDAVLAGPLCNDGVCSCREEAKGEHVAGVPDSGLKRYEVRVGPIGNDLRVSVGPHTLYKTNERPTECFYVDLPPGNHQISVRAHGNPSFGAAAYISEMGGVGKYWYESFSFRCGSNVCSLEDLKSWRSEISGIGPKQDPCGSTKVKAINYRTDRPPDGIHPTNLYVEATLQVYEFTPKTPPCPER